MNFRIEDKGLWACSVSSYLNEKAGKTEACKTETWVVIWYSQSYLIFLLFFFFFTGCTVVGMVVGVAVDGNSKVGRRESVFIQCLQSCSPMLTAFSSSKL